MLAKSKHTKRFLCAAAAVLVTVPAMSLVVPERDAAIAEKEYRHADLQIPNVYSSARQLPESLSAGLLSDLAALGVSPDGAYMDERSGRWGTLLPATPLLPGDGKGNTLTWEGLQATAPASPSQMREAAWTAFRSYLEANRSYLQFDVSELANPARMDMSQRDLIQIHAPRVIDGVQVRNSFLTAVISHGNLILLGSRNWDDVNVSRTPTIDLDSARNVALDHLSGLIVDGEWRRPHLAIVPTANGSFLQTPVFGEGTGYRLVWVLSPNLEDDLGNWEALVDAHSGQLITFLDQNHYATARSVVGGVYPASNDGTPPDGVEQPMWPMPFADVMTDSGDVFVTDSGGNLPACVDGAISTTLDGQYMRMADNCGNISESSPGNLDLGTSGGDDCTVPPGGSAGNTHSSRSGFYEMNRILEQARGQLPDNVWTTEQLTSNMNINQSCNAFWSGSTVNFYRSGGGCGNTGELAGVFDHEWGHGMDDNGVNSNISNPGEGIPDIYAALRLNDSCLGRGFLGGNCNGYGDGCLDCSGVRDIDFANRVSGEPHGIDFALSNCGNGPAPCGGIVHCEGALYAEAVWDLFNRDLPSEYGWDLNTSIELATRLTYVGANPVGSWFNCNEIAGTGDGCNADGGYLNYLAADDDNGDINDGTPHMTAIARAFDRHDISCATPVPQDSGCSDTPGTAPNVEAIPVDRGALLSWTPVGGADRYEIFRTDGVFGCDMGKEKIGETTGTSFADEGLLNGREYYYTVAAMGSGATCLGPMSDCTTVMPVTGPNLNAAPDSASIVGITGDGDDFIDNCEEATLSFDIVNSGNGLLSNVQIVDVQAISHPGVELTSSLPIPVTGTLSGCDEAVGAFDFTADGLSFNDTVTFLVDLTGDELNGMVRTVEVSLSAAESDLQQVASQTFNIEDDADGWEVVQGTFARTDGGGANGTEWFFDSSSFLNEACDQIVSPLVRLSESSTLSMYSNFDIEGGFDVTWYDRANVGVTEASGNRTPIVPDGGRLYNAKGANGTCGTTDQEGFAGNMATWEESQWSAVALDANRFGGNLVQLSVNYGTDDIFSAGGFSFDEITLTDFEVQGEDQQPNTCDASDVPEVNLTGTCPGSITLTVENGTPGGAVRIYRSDSVGGTTVQSGQCSGLELDIDDAKLVAQSTLDGNGEIVSIRPASGAQCGLYLQAVDVSTCTPTDRVRIPQ